MCLLGNYLLNVLYISAGACFKNKQHEHERFFEAQRETKSCLIYLQKYDLQPTQYPIALGLKASHMEVGGKNSTDSCLQRLHLCFLLRYPPFFFIMDFFFCSNSKLDFHGDIKEGTYM